MEYTNCDNSHLIMFRNEKGRKIALGSTIYMTPETKIQITCGSDIRSIIVVEEKIIDQMKPIWTRNLNCQDFLPFDVHENTKKYFKTKLSARTTVDQHEIIKTYFYVVSLENPVLTLSLPDGTECAPNTASPHFSCIIQNYEAFQLKYLRVSLKALHAIIGELNSTVGEMSLRQIPVVAAGEYTCQAEVVYRTCSPFSEHRVEGTVVGHLHKSCLPLNIKSEYVKVIERLKGERLRLPELEKTLIESDPKNRNLILNGEALFVLSQHLMVPISDYENAKEYVQKNLGPCEPDPKGSRRDPLSKTQYLNIPCYVHAKVVTMNISRMLDWKMKPLIIAVLPKPPDFARFWELVVSDKIGTVLWIGDFEAGSKTLIDAYICRMANGSRELNEQRFCIMVRIRTVSVLKFDKYAIYTIKFQVKKGSVKTFGLVTVIHVLVWPINQVPPYTSSFQITELCCTIETYQQKRGAKWPGVLIHDSCSVERSAAIAALIICRQIYVERRRVNFLAVLKYVRAARLGCFNTRANGHVQMALVATCLAALAKSIQEEVAAEQKNSNSKSKSDNSVFGGSKRSQNLKKSSTYAPFSASKSPSAAVATSATSAALLTTARKQSTVPVSKTRKSVIPSKPSQSISKPSSGSQDLSLDKK
uniref:Tyrosine-protein phosphatase domain-containing protein n=1 Tax=Romanomermis culicivorax TaxID=13658 RepID=A0A915HQP5_ROMCU